MARTMLVVTDRSTFVATCRPAIAGVGAGVRAVEPAQLGEVLAAGALVLFDGESDAYVQQDDELLVALGLARALRATAALVLGAGAPSDVDDLAAELCPGLVARTSEDLHTVIRRLAKRAEGIALPRFEYVTVSPRDNELLAILSNGSAEVIARPCNGDDTGGDVVSIDLGEDARSATLALEGGGHFVLDIEAISPRPTATLNGSSEATALDGAKVGSRLRELRKAAGLTQAELARRTGIHRPNIARVEAGRHTPSLETLARIAAAIGVSATRVLSAD